MLEKAVVIARSYGASTTSERAADVATLISTLPQKPLSNPHIKPYVCDVAAVEKYLCRRYGHPNIPEQIINIIREGISIRIVSSDGKPGRIVGLFPTTGHRSYSTADIDLIEVLLHKRMTTFWRASPPSRRGVEPRLCQVGHILPDALAEYELDLSKTFAHSQAKAALTSAVTGLTTFIGTKVWQGSYPQSIGSKSASQDVTSREALLASWNGRTQAQKERFEKIFEALVARFYRH